MAEEEWKSLNTAAVVYLSYGYRYAQSHLYSIVMKNLYLIFSVQSALKVVSLCKEARRRKRRRWKTKKNERGGGGGKDGGKEEKDMYSFTWFTVISATAHVCAQQRNFWLRRLLFIWGVLCVHIAPADLWLMPLWQCVVSRQLLR